MPWSVHRYPPAMRNLPPVLRDKAIEIANAMLAEGIEEGQAIRMAIAAARWWGHGARSRFALAGGGPPMTDYARKSRSDPASRPLRRLRLRWP